jgi:hypothetical protein
MSEPKAAANGLSCCEEDLGFVRALVTIIMKTAGFMTTRISGRFSRRLRIWTCQIPCSNTAKGIIMIRLQFL